MCLRLSPKRCANLDFSQHKPIFHLATSFARREAKTRIRQRKWLTLVGEKIRREQVRSYFFLCSHEQIRQVQNGLKNGFFQDMQIGKHIGTKLKFYLLYTVCPRKKSPFRNDTSVVKCALLRPWEFKLASTCKTNSNTIITSNYNNENTYVIHVDNSFKFPEA